MTTPNESAGFFGGGAPSAKFPEGAYNTTVGGVIVEPPTMQQQRDYDDNTPLFYKDTGAPMMQLVVTVQTDLRDPNVPDDDGQRRFFVKGAMKAAVGQAMRKARSQQLDVGGALYVTYTHDGEPSNPKNKPPKQYTAVYQPPAAADQAQYLGVAAQPAVAQPVAQPVYAAPVAQPVQQYVAPAPAPQYGGAGQNAPQYVAPAAPVAQPVAVAPTGLPPGLTPEAAAALAALQQPQAVQQ